MSTLIEAAAARGVLKDMAGMRFGRLLVVDRHSTDKFGQAIWTCLCDCGNKSAVRGSALRRGQILSCGCYFLQVACKTNVKHGLGRTRTASIWRGMISRCTNTSNKAFHNYGGRGIAVCERWLDFLTFLEDMGERPVGHSIERIDNERGYEPNNCKWIPVALQIRNRRNTLKFDGRPLIEIAEETGIRYATLYSRLKKYGTPFAGVKA